MKLSAALLIFSGTFAQSGVETLVSRVARAGEDRRYAQLTDMMEHYNSNFDERQYWAYGCNCLILGDRPMSDPGKGQPVDSLDAVCKKYKDCQKCAREEFGDMCIGEFVQYRYGTQGGEKVCQGTPGTCDRKLCECDLQFAKDHVSHTSAYDAAKHLFYGNGWNPDTDCNHPTGSATPKCCGKDNGPSFIFNAAGTQCCTNGELTDCFSG